MSFQPKVVTPRATFPLCETPVHTDVLLDILSYPRFDGTEGELAIINKYLVPLPGAEFDDHGNIWVRIGTKPTTLFSCHTDTVAKRSATKRNSFVTVDGLLGVEGGGVLGADCGTGIWLMLNLIERQMPGLYIFHRAEELGRVGSEAIAGDPELVARLAGVKHCIAFDRKDTTHIITHQMGERCCSEAFSEALGAQLSTFNNTFVSDDTGSYTDSYSYRGLIAECTNISVGYYDQHSQFESQDLAFATCLASKLLWVDWANLPAERVPEIEAFDDSDFDFDYPAWRPGSKQPRWQGTAGELDALPVHAQHAQLADLVTTYPNEVAEILQAQGFDYRDLIEELELTYGEDLSHLAYLV